MYYESTFNRCKHNIRKTWHTTNGIIIIQITEKWNLKIAKIIPIFKKEDRTVLNKYRPISLLPIIFKVVEQVICDQINNVFVKHKLLFDHQYGFRSGHSTKHAALALTDRIITNIDNKKSNKYLP